MKMLRVLVTVVAAVVLLLPVLASACKQVKVDLPVNLSGTMSGAPYRIRVPANWNGTLLVFAHGYGRQLTPFLPITPSYVDPMQEEHFLALGYALAASAYSSGGWAVDEGLEQTAELTRYFRRTIGHPEKTILWGRSMGSAVTLRSIETHPNLYDGAIPMCDVAAGTTRTFDETVDLSVAYDLLFGWPASWGDIGNVRNDLVFTRDVAPVVASKLLNADGTLNRANFAKFEFLRLVAHRSPAGFYQPPTPYEPPFLFQAMYFATEALAEIQVRAGGHVVQNVDHLYSLTAAEKAYLASMGIDADTLLAAMNARRTVTADPHARRYLERYADYSGHIKGPVLTLHGIYDGLVIPQHESKYRETVEAAGRGDRLVQTFTTSVGHCDYSNAQLEAVVRAMESWIDTRSAPTPASFPEAIGFIPGYMPGPWPSP
ncbi:MAG: hypothetical protein QM765_07275 [Myxococcales bacterium]